MATPTNPASANPVPANHVPANQAPANQVPANQVRVNQTQTNQAQVQAAALSAGVRSVMGEDASAAQPEEAAASEARASAGADGAGMDKDVEGDVENALVSSAEALELLEEQGLIDRQSVTARLPVQLDVGIPIRDFRVRSLITLAPGALIESQWEPGEDVPVASSDVQLAWSEFEVVDTQLAVRLTRLA